ncbi:cytochrome o ubiquinol oxidase subunit IV [Noviherbaspirillum malthae]|jgi:cytochrome o ubiquinol oxidase operon protein cyoD|uniref:cytochrome o ubiquinol oxidase subunit IV n=1 Tax=Noviherbaspirillum malthae TaxID=1260987 RepID=UPI00188FFFCA|nr:cytochrome o ubiquinol oxidase subunit IV [Noviherbaspirillum malthae]
MSEHHMTTAHADDHGHHDHHEHDDHANHGSLKSYTIGFILSVILTAIPFWMVMGNVFESSSTTAMVILGFAAVQIVVHMIYFLHMNTKAEGGWSMLALIFTIVIVVITLAGSLWVMYHLNHNMMPGMMHDGTHSTHKMP